MGGARPLQTALLGALAAAAMGVSLAAAQQVGAVGQIDLTDPADELRGRTVDFSVTENPTGRFDLSADALKEDGPRRLELELAAGGGDAPLDVSIAQRAALGGDSNGDIDRSGRGSELRIGRGLVRERENSDRGSTYVFVASENEALTWQPGARSEFGGQGSSFALQDRVEVGDVSAGVTYERNGVQASLAYVEREESTRVGRETFSQDESFTGVTVTMRR